MKNVLLSKEDQFLDFASFIVNTAIECEEDMGFLKADEYHKGNFENCKYSNDETVWSNLEILIGRDYDQMEKEFKTVKWEDNYNTAIVSFVNDPKKYAILRM